MAQLDIATPTRTREILDTYRVSAKKSLGQNFIIDTNILDKMIEVGQIDEQTTVLEIGSGVGALTEQIAKYAKCVYSFEIDERFLPVLDDTLSSYSNVTVLHQDILKADLEQFHNDYLKDAERVVAMANLPYYVTTPIILGLLNSTLELDTMVFMMQKEVASRISAKPSTKAYGSLSIAIQYYMDAQVVFTVPKTVFMPQPNVESAVIRLMPKKEPEVTVENEPFFFEVTRSAFVQRRKTLWNNLKVAYGKDKAIQSEVQDALKEANIDPSRRGETLSIKEFGRLSDSLYRKGLKQLTTK